MMRKIGFYFAGFVAAILASIAISRADCQGALLGGEDPGLEIDLKICHSRFTIGYSDRLRSPLWSAEHLTLEQLADAAEHKRDCSIGQSQAVSDGATNADYLHTGFDRGHMAPAGDFGTDQQSTCGLANMVPQLPGLNRIVWRAIERQTRELAEAQGGAYVLTGPIYSGAPAYLSERIPIPESVFKIVVSSVGAWAYVATNHLPITCRLISIAQLESQRGVRLVPFLDDIRRSDSWMPEPVKGCVLWEGG